MKVLLGDNQFFGVNHYDLKKGLKVKEQFDSLQKIKDFIDECLGLGLQGFMINSNKLGYDLINKFNFPKNKEIHYSIPYPHKYASMVNENGMASLLNFAFKNTSLLNNLKFGTKLIIDKDFKNLVPIGVDLEISKNLSKGNYIYLQNIVTDLLIGLNRIDIIIEFIKTAIALGYNPGIITLNPLLLHEKLNSYDAFENITKIENLIVCFNVNNKGFNVFPSKKDVEDYLRKDVGYKRMGMSIFSSGASEIEKSITYIKTLNLDYVVFGSSKVKNVKSSYHKLTTS